MKSFSVETRFNGVDNVTPKLKGIADASERTRKSVEKISNALKIGAIAVGSALTVSAKKALDFEEQMVSLSRFTPTFDNVEKQASYMNDLTNSIYGLSDSSGKAKSDIISMYEAFGQQGIDPKKWENLSKSIIKISTALDLTAQEASQSLLKIAASVGKKGDFNYIDELAGSMNLVADNAGATVDQLVDVSKRAAGIATAAGLTTDQLLALSGAAIDAGANAEVLSRSFKTILTTFSSIKGGVSTTGDAFKELGIKRKEFVKEFNKDQFKALNTLKDKFKDVANPLQTATALVGKEFSAELLRMINSIEKSESLIDGLADKRKAAARLQQEYDKQQSSNNAKIRRSWQKIDTILLRIGSRLLPIIAKVLKEIEPILNNILDYLEKNPEAINKAIKAIGIFGATLAGAKVLGAVKDVGFAVVGVGKSVKGLKSLGGLSKILGAGAFLTAAYKIGYEIGSWYDKLTGTSTMLSDFASKLAGHDDLPNAQMGKFAITRDDDGVLYEQKEGSDKKVPLNTPKNNARIAQRDIVNNTTSPVYIKVVNKDGSISVEKDDEKNKNGYRMMGHNLGVMAGG